MKKGKVFKPEPSPPTYPARPMNGGRLEIAEPLDEEEWRYRPKWNGRRVLLHVPTMRTWNRQLEQNNWVFPCFKKLLDIVTESDVLPPVLEWLDLELLYGKTSVAKRSIIVLDYISNNEVWWDRMMTLNVVFQGHILAPSRTIPEHDSVSFAPPIAPDHVQSVWSDLQTANKEAGATFFEGLVAYEMRSKYPVQLFSPNRETRHWVKFRFTN